MKALNRTKSALSAAAVAMTILSAASGDSKPNDGSVADSSADRAKVLGIQDGKVHPSGDSLLEIPVGSFRVRGHVADVMKRFFENRIFSDYAKTKVWKDARVPLPIRMTIRSDRRPACGRASSGES